jgi:hypothetical protein
VAIGQFSKTLQRLVDDSRSTATSRSLPLLCVGARGPADTFALAMRDSPLLVAGVEHLADALRALACREFTAVLFVGPQGAEGDQRARWAFERIAPGRAQPLWLRLEDGTPGLAHGSLTTLVAPGDVALHVRRFGRSGVDRREVLSSAQLEAMEATEEMCGPFIAEAFTAYVRGSADLLDAIDAACRSAAAARAGERALALASLADGLGDVRTAAGARLLERPLRSDGAVPAASAVAALRRTRDIGVESLRLYLSADALTDPSAWNGPA